MLSKANLVLEVDAGTGRIVRADEALESALGFGAGELAGRDCSVLAGSRARFAGRRDHPVAEIFMDATHDLVAPLNQAALLIALLVRKHEAALSGPDTQEILGHIQTAVQRMQGLADGLKTLSRMLSEPMSPKRIDANTLVAAAIRNCTRKFDPNDFDISSENLPEITADVKRMQFVFDELLENAIKYRSGAPVRIEVRASANGGEWVFSIRDTGPGFDTRSAQEVFRLFRRMAAGAVPGRGVGLAICRQIVQLHGGEIRVESEPGSGTTVSFTLPGNGPEESFRDAAQ